MGVVDRVRSLFAPERADFPISLDTWINYFRYGNNTYTYQLNQTLNGNREEIASNFAGLVSGAFRTNGVVFAAMVARQMLFAEAGFQWRQRRGGVPGDLFGTADLAILEKPWPRASTSDLLARAEQDSTLAGTAFFTRRRRDRIRRLRPDWTTIVCGSPYADADDDLSAYDVDAELLGLIYKPGGPGSGREAEVIDASSVAIYAPTPDPMANYRGVSWLTAVIPEIQADKAANAHKERFFVNGATVNLVVQTGLSNNDLARFTEWVSKFKEGHEGVEQAYKTLFLTAGADAKAIGADLVESDFKAITQAGETRIAAASQIHPTILGVSEGLQGSSLNTGNFEAAARLTANKFLRPAWRNIAHSFEDIVPPPNGAELWYDDRDIPFLAEDVEKAATVQSEEAKTIQTLITAGFTPDSIVNAVTAHDWERLEHTGLYSVQLQPPTTAQPTPETPAPSNGQGSKEDANAVVSQAG